MKKDELFFGTQVLEPKKSNLAVLGIPWDASSSFRKGAKRAPNAIRESTTAKLYNPYSEKLVNLTEEWKIFDMGDLSVSNLEPQIIPNRISKTLNQIHDISKKYLFLGGDHLITFFCFKALTDIGAINEKNIGLIYLDAHPDLYDQYENKLYSHACVIKRIIDKTSIQPKYISLLGIRASTREQDLYIKHYGIKAISRQQLNEKGIQWAAENIRNNMNGVEKIYLSLDMDVLDPAFAPGVGNPEPGGLHTTDLVRLIQKIKGMPIFAFDIVEYCPKYDISNITGYATAKLIKEILAILPHS